MLNILKKSEKKYEEGVKNVALYSPQSFLK